MINSSIYSDGRKSIENQKQNSISIDYQSFNSSCITNKGLKSINHFRSSINNYYKHMRKNNSLVLNIFHLNNSIKSKIEKNKKLNHNFIKTKSCDVILPNISQTLSTSPKQKYKNLKISLNNDNNDFNINNNKNIFFTLNKSNFSTSVNSLNIKNKSNISNKKKLLKNELSSYINTNNKNKNILSLNNASFYNIDEYTLKRENLCDYLNKTKKIIMYKYAQNDLKKLFQLEKEKKESNLEQHNLNLNLLKKLHFLFKKYIASFDTYFFNVKEEIRNCKKENTNLIEKKKKLFNEIFVLGHTVYRIKNKFKDYLNNKYFLLSVKNHTKKFNYFSAKDKNEFNSDLLLLDILDQRLNSIFMIPLKDKENGEKIKEKYDKIEEIRKFSVSNKDGFKKFKQGIKKRFYTQKSINDSMKAKNIFNTPKQFMKDLNLISKGINDSLKVFNRIQVKLLEDKKLLNILNKKSFENENFQNEFNDKQAELTIKINSSINYHKYLVQQKNLLLSSSKRSIKREIVLNKIKYILNNIQMHGTTNLLKFLDKSENKESSENNLNNNIIAKYSNEIDMLKIIEKTIIFLQNINNEYKKKDKDNYYEIEENIKYLRYLNNFRKAREKEKNKKKDQLRKILEKSHNFLFLPNKKNYFISNRKEKSEKIKKMLLKYQKVFSI